MEASIHSCILALCKWAATGRGGAALLYSMLHTDGENFCSFNTSLDVSLNKILICEKSATEHLGTSEVKTSFNHDMH